MAKSSVSCFLIHGVEVADRQNHCAIVLHCIKFVWRIYENLFNFRDMNCSITVYPVEQLLLVL